MDYKQLLYNSEAVLSIYPELAVILNDYDEIKLEGQKKKDKKRKRPDRSGLNKAIVINQLNYWNNKNENKNRNYFDGYFWSYNSYEGWAKTNFPFWSPTTVKRIFTSLEDDGIIVSCKHNQLKIDNTKWYRINYEKLQEIIDIVEKHKAEKYISENSVKPSDEVNKIHCEQISGHYDQSIGSELSDDEVIMTKPIPENNYRDYTTETINNAFSKEKETGSEVQYPAPVSVPKYTYTPEQLYTYLSVKLDELGKGMIYYKEYKIKELVDIIIYFHKKFKQETGMAHPVLSDDSYRTIVREFLDPPEITRFYCLYNYDDYKKLIDLYFNENYGNYGEITKYISHFMSDEIRENLAKKIFIDT